MVTPKGLLKTKFVRYFFFNLKVGSKRILDLLVSKIENQGHRRRHQPNILRLQLTYVEVAFLPPNTTSHFQPLDAKIIASFKAATSPFFALDASVVHGTCPAKILMSRPYPIHVPSKNCPSLQFVLSRQHLMGYNLYLRSRDFNVPNIAKIFGRVLDCPVPSRPWTCPVPMTTLLDAGQDLHNSGQGLGVTEDPRNAVLADAINDYFLDLEKEIPTEDVLDDNNIVRLVQEEMFDGEINEIDSEKEEIQVSLDNALKSIQTWISFFEQQQSDESLIINKDSVRLNQISYETTSSNLAHANIKGFFFFLVKFDGSLMNAFRKWQTLYIPRRLIVLGLCALAILINYADRSNIAVAIVYMAKEFGWSSTTQGLVLSSFFVGYLTTQVLGGALADKFGGKWVLGVAAVGWTTFTLLTPSAAKLGLNYLLSCRILLGIAEGACFPSVHSLIASWAPLEERSRAVAIITSSNHFGSIIAFPVSTWLGSGPWGWESIFWVFGTVGVIWSLIWQIYGGSDPSTYPGISKEELDLILKDNHKESRSYYSSLPTDEEEAMNRSSENVINVADGDDDDDVISEEIDESFTAIKNSNPSHIPWRLIFSRREVWAIIIAYVCHSGGFFMLLNWLPTYYLDHFGVDIKYLGYFTVLPYIAQGVSGFFVGILADYVINRLKVRVIIVRRIAQIIGSCGIAIFLLLATHVAKTPLQGIILITIGNGLNSFTLAGLTVSQLDIAPRYSGLIFGLGNSLGMIPVIVGLTLTGWVLDSTGKNWNIIWNTASALYFTGAFAFSILAGEKVVIE
ncbi:unnamed protein product [Rhizophagus irregularis]|nr:unnamed protein product [Rhizophagus irregularis]